MATFSHALASYTASVKPAVMYQIKALKFWYCISMKWYIELAIVLNAGVSMHGCMGDAIFRYLCR